MAATPTFGFLSKLTAIHFGTHDTMLTVECIPTFGPGAAPLMSTVSWTATRAGDLALAAAGSSVALFPVAPLAGGPSDTLNIYKSPEPSHMVPPDDADTQTKLFNNQYAWAVEDLTTHSAAVGFFNLGLLNGSKAFTVVFTVGAPFVGSASLELRVATWRVKPKWPTDLEINSFGLLGADGSLHHPLPSAIAGTGGAATAPNPFTRFTIHTSADLKTVTITPS